VPAGPPRERLVPAQSDHFLEIPLKSTAALLSRRSPSGPLVPVPSRDMEEFLQRAKSKLDRSKQLEQVHAVIGPKSCDLDSLISAFTYAYFLDKVSPPGVLCLPVLNIPRTEFNYFTETRFILEELNIPESFHIFRDEINLHQLNDEGKLSITLVGSHVLGSEDRTLESAVVRVINPGEQSDGELGFPETSSSLVLKELLREAPELITQQLAHLLRGSILFTWNEYGS
ncbi:mCG13979, isoform CRA_b, partial [Mus musculus]